MARGGAGVLLAGVLGAAAACRGGDGRAEPPSPVVGQFLEGFSFPDLTGSAVSWSPTEGLHLAGNARTQEAVVVHAFQSDCPACRQQAVELEQLVSERPESAIVGVAHRLTQHDVQAFAEDVGATYPLLLGSGSSWAERWGRGDSMYVVDRTGSILYSQVGFHPSDPARWDAVLDDIHAGRAVRYSGPERNALVVGEALPPIELPVVGGLSAASLRLDDEGALVFEQRGTRRRFRAAVGFFSRY